MTHLSFFLKTSQRFLASSTGSFVPILENNKIQICSRGTNWLCSHNLDLRQAAAQIALCQPELVSIIWMSQQDYFLIKRILGVLMMDSAFVATD